MSGWWPDAGTFAALTDLRVREPDLPLELAKRRRRRARLTPDGRLSLLAADHPGRGLTSVNDAPSRMSDRRDYLRRVVRVLQTPGMDGVMATMDVLEELLLLDHLGRTEGRAPLLDQRLLIVSVNRGGTADSAWELLDPMTGPSAATAREYELDGGKFLLRFDPDDPHSLDTMVGCAATARAFSDAGLPFFVEPLVTTRGSAGISIVDNPARLARLVGITSALGNTTRRLWLKLPLTSPMQTVCRATTLPVVLLGGRATNTDAFLDRLASALDAADNIRGVMLGRNVLYPSGYDPAEVAARVVALVRR